MSALSEIFAHFGDLRRESYRANSFAASVINKISDAVAETTGEKAKDGKWRWTWEGVTMEYAPHIDREDVHKTNIVFTMIPTGDALQRETITMVFTPECHVRMTSETANGRERHEPISMVNGGFDRTTLAAARILFTMKYINPVFARFMEEMQLCSNRAHGYRAA